MAEFNGTSSNDTLIGTDQDDSIFGLDGDDYLEGLAGNDTLDGGSGVNRLVGSAGNDLLINGVAVYLDDASGVFVNLTDVQRTHNGRTVSARTAIDGWGGTDVLGDNVVSGYASDHDDIWFASGKESFVFLGDGSDVAFSEGNTALYGEAGDDFLKGSEGAVNVLIGGEGNDTLTDGIIDYVDDPTGVIVNLSDSDRSINGTLIGAGTAIDGWGGTDVLRGTIAGGSGSSYDDYWLAAPGPFYVFLGDGDDVAIAQGGSYLSGQAGNDVLEGDGSDTDQLAGGAGNDTLLGGVVQYEDDPAGVIVNLTDSDEVIDGRVVAAHQAIDGWGGTDVLGEDVT